MSFYLNRKSHNRYKKNLNYKCHILKFGCFGIKAVDFGVLTKTENISLQRLLNKEIKLVSKKFGTIKFWNLVFMNSTVTALSPESRMGKGKGSISTQFCYIKPGQFLFEFSGVSKQQMVQIYKVVKLKFPLKTKVVNFCF
uniref:Ribosomal protein L16 n=1 Tax=Kumanoa mahlacensis TaxID=1196387 RepID=A0A343UXX4_9FLOR|nr:ribosomal protein L16 [Kumanoa mahlacensis]AVK39531.1 ribosomal protein L16 [Kumanoa mahlacensis]UEQ11863.1 ribosomal protein L16 [Kumanoa mahlacensis]